ncbi:uncharacterized protein LOC143459123 [Clavelina lepadiformis]|uniref:uncharacterized protein LOC143459123 n=1 Tax=Clavelina lepadiformis TaxID=159417 RepID=UPI0040432AD0
MAKKSKSLAIENEDNNKKLIGYRGRWYDVSNFTDYHPGGKVIEKFVGHDATCVIDSMHKHNVLEKRTPVGCYSLSLGNFDRCMNDLEHKFRTEGYYDNSFRWYVRKSITTLLIIVLVFCLVVSGAADENIFCVILTGVFLALFWQQSGMLMHDFMHTQFFQHRLWDEKVGVFFGTVCFGISARWWKDKHIIHHAFTNTVEPEENFVDPQAMEALWAQNVLLFPFHTASWQAFFVKIQHFIFVPITVGLGRIGIIVDSFREEKRLDVWAALLAHWFWVVLLLSYFTSWQKIVFVYWCGCIGEGILHVQLLLNHYSKRFYTMSEKRNEEYYRSMIDCNLNITCPWWMDWLHGGLNFHHEHHSFPRLPRDRLREASVHIKQICSKNNVHYDECCFTVAFCRTIYNLSIVSDKFRKMLKND